MLFVVEGMPALSDEMYDTQLEQLRQMNPATIRQLLLISEKFKDFYDGFDKMLGNKGYAKYVIISILITLLLVFGLVLWRIFGYLWSFVGGNISSTNSDPILTNIEPLIPENGLAINSESEFEF